MKKQYRIVNNGCHSNYVEIYYDGELRKRNLYDNEYTIEEIKHLEVCEYTQGYLPEDIKEAKEDYIEKASNLIGQPNKKEKAYFVPCDIGDTVYICTFCDEWYPPEEIDKCEFKVIDIRITTEGIIFQAEKGENNNSFFRLEDIDVNVFLSKEEALPKMAEGIKNNLRLENLFKNKE